MPDFFRRMGGLVFAQKTPNPERQLTCPHRRAEYSAVLMQALATAYTDIWHFLMMKEVGDEYLEDLDQFRRAGDDERQVMSAIKLHDAIRNTTLYHR